MASRTAHLERFLVIEANTDEGSCVFVTVLPADVVREKGLIPQSIVGKLRQPTFDHRSIEPEDFVSNGVFRTFLHEMIAKFAPQEASFQLAAKQRRGGLVVVTDGRTPTPEGPVPPADIFGIFEIPLEESEPPIYKPNPNHQLMTDNGFFQLPGDLHQRLLESLATLISES